jgi:heat shock 70kDa protein 1/2/6/8
VSILEVGGGLIEVLATFGDNHLGGNDFDKAIADSLLAEYRKQHGVGIPQDRQVMRRLMDAAERARIQLSTAKSVDIELADLWGGKGVKTRLGRRQMEQLCDELYRRLLVPLRQAALMAGVSLDGEISPDALFRGDDDGEAEPAELSLEDFAQGKNLAALKAKATRGRQMSRMKSDFSRNVNALRRKNPGRKIREFPVGKPLTEVVMVGGATRMPSIQKLVEVVTGIKPKITVNPDEAVALGAGIHAGMLDGSITDLDVMTPMQAAILRAQVDYENRRRKAKK